MEHRSHAPVGCCHTSRSCLASWCQGSLKACSKFNTVQLRTAQCSWQSIAAAFHWGRLASQQHRTGGLVGPPQHHGAVHCCREQAGTLARAEVGLPSQGMDPVLMPNQQSLKHHAPAIIACCERLPRRIPAGHDHQLLTELSICSPCCKISCGPARQTIR